MYFISKNKGFVELVRSELWGTKITYFCSVHLSYLQFCIPYRLYEIFIKIPNCEITGICNKKQVIILHLHRLKKPLSSLIPYKKLSFGRFELMSSFPSTKSSAAVGDAPIN